MGGTTKETNTTTSQSQATQQASQQGSQQATQQGTTPWAATSGLLGKSAQPDLGGLSSNLDRRRIGRALASSRPMLPRAIPGLPRLAAWRTRREQYAKPNQEQT